MLRKIQEAVLTLKLPILSPTKPPKKGRKMEMTERTVAKMPVWCLVSPSSCWCVVKCGQGITIAAGSKGVIATVAT